MAAAYTAWGDKASWPEWGTFLRDIMVGIASPAETCSNDSFDVVDGAEGPWPPARRTGQHRCYCPMQDTSLAVVFEQGWEASGDVTDGVSGSQGCTSAVPKTETSFGLPQALDHTSWVQTARNLDTHTASWVASWTSQILQLSYWNQSQGRNFGFVDGIDL